MLIPEYTLDRVFYPQEDKQHLMVKFTSGDFSETEVLIENFFIPDDSDQMEVTYSIVENPLGIKEDDEKFVEQFSIIMNDIMNKVIKEVLEYEKEQRGSDQ